MPCGVGISGICELSVLQESQVTRLPSSYLQPRKNDNQNDKSFVFEGTSAFGGLPKKYKTPGLGR